MTKKSIVHHDIVIDASRKTLGRLASEAIFFLRGKSNPNFSFEKLPKQVVRIQNIKKIQFKEKKISEKTYIKHSRYPGGLKERKISVEFEKNPKTTFYRIIKNMLPKNRQRSVLLKNIIIE